MLYVVILVKIIKATKENNVCFIPYSEFVYRNKFHSGLQAHQVRQRTILGKYILKLHVIQMCMLL